MATPIVSIIVPSYNQGQFLQDALDSVLAQTYANWECIVVNDGSEDNTKEVALFYCHHDSRFHYIEQSNQGVSVARNNGIKASQGVYILPLDGDDKLGATFLEKAVNCMTSSPQTTLVYSRVGNFDNESEEIVFPEYKYEDFIWTNCIVNTAMFRRADYDRTIGYNPNMKEGLEDWDFWLSLLSEGAQVHRIDEILFFYRFRAGSRNVKSVDVQQTLLTQIFHNHSNIYKPYADKIVYYHKLALDGLGWKKDYENATADAKSARDSHAYRLGAFLLKPFKWIKGIIS